jgi:hypothetical protein
MQLAIYALIVFKRVLSYIKTSVRILHLREHMWNLAPTACNVHFLCNFLDSAHVNMKMVYIPIKDQ